MKMNLRLALAVVALLPFASLAMAAPINPFPAPGTGIVSSAPHFSAPIDPWPRPGTGIVSSAPHFSAPIDPWPRPGTGITLPLSGEAR
jgi:hypothetical protein